jgi:hypothetical protein
MQGQIFYLVCNQNLIFVQRIKYVVNGNWFLVQSFFFGLYYYCFTTMLEYKIIQLMSHNKMLLNWC